MTHPLRWPAVILLSAALMSDLLLSGAQGPVRVVVTLWFVLLCPGMAFVPLLSISSAAEELLLGFALSLALGTLATTAIVVVGGLSATTGLFVLQGVCLVGCAMQVWRWSRERRVPVAFDVS